MIPGRELDALIAERVIGWKRGEHVGLKREVWKLPEPYPDPGWDWCSLDSTPRFSTSIAYAWEVVEKLENRFNLSMSRKWHHYIETDSFGWQVKAQFWDRKQFGPDSSQWVIAQAVPHAICLAALKAIGHEVK